MKLTKNEKETLKLLIKNSKFTDTEIASQLKITKQAVGIIRKKLERLGIIKGYSAKIDYEKLGINTFAIVMFKFTKEGWKELKDKGLKDTILQTPNIISFYRIPKGDITHIALYGFRSLEELDKYAHIVQSRFVEYIEIKDIYIFSNESAIKECSETLLIKVVDEMEKDVMAEPIPLKR